MWWRSTQDKQEVERKLREYFRSEADSEQPSPQWWDKALSDLGQQKQPPRWRSALAWLTDRPVPALAASIATVVVVAGFSVLLIGRLSTDSRLLPKDSSTTARAGMASPAAEQNANDNNKSEMAAGAIPSTPSPVPPTPSPAPEMLKEGWQLSGLPTSPAAGQDVPPAVQYPIRQPDATYGPGSPTPTPRPPGPAPVPPTPLSRPAPRTYETTTGTDKPFYAAGETIVVSVSITNVSVKPLELRNFPGKLTLDLLGTPEDEAFAVETTTRSARLEPGQGTSARIEVPGALSATLARGRYAAHLGDIYIVTEGGESGIGLGAGIFTILPPQGALQETITLNEMRESQGVRITLHTIEARPEMAILVAVAVPPGFTPPENPTTFPRGMMLGRYRVDEGQWREVNASYRDTAEGVRLEWVLEPIPADAKTFEFAVTAFAISPGQTATGPWEWVVGLQATP